MNMKRKNNYFSKKKTITIIVVFAFSFIILDGVLITPLASAFTWDDATGPGCDGGSCDGGTVIDVGGGTYCPSCTDQCLYYGQRECTDSTHYHQCGNYDCDACLEWSSSYSCGAGKVCSGGQCISSCSDECSYYGQSEKSCSGNYVQEKTCGNYDSDACLEWSSWSNIQNCGSDYWTDNYQCSGTWVQRQKVLKGCSGGSCYQNTQWVNQTNCADQGKVCSNGQCITQCTSHSYKQCHDSDVYWYDSCHQKEEKYEDCGVSGWTTDYRCSDSRYLQRKWLDKGCSNASCFSNEDWRTQEDCGTDSWTDNYRCSDDWVQREKTLKGCSSLSCYQNSQWFNYENCTDQGKTCSGGQCVYTDLNVTCSAYPNPAGIGQNVVFSANATGGTGSYSYTWTGACSGYLQTCSNKFYYPGTQTAVLNVVSGSQSDSASCSVQVNEPQCTCGCWSTWQDQGCGQGSCCSTQMLQKRTRDCNPDACNTEVETRCVADSSCEPSCQDECAYQGQTTCSDNNSKKTCGYYDSDSCLEWSSSQSCGTDGCSGSTYRDYYCSGGVCSHNDQTCSSQCYYCGDGECNSECGENTSNCCQDCGCGDEEDPATGNLSANRTSLCEDETVNISISAQDDDGIEKISLYYSGSWHNHDCSGNTTCNKTWSISEGHEGYYNYTGMVYGKKVNGSQEQAYTSPSTITIHFDDCGEDCQDECAYSGQVRCSGYSSRQTCGNYDSDSCLEWSNSQSCSGATYCGYGSCDEDERPEWYCSGGYCEYRCNYSSSCNGYDDHDDKRCYNDDVYWYDSSGHRDDKYEECGSDSCGSWQYYCSGDKVYKKRTCYERGCRNDRCFEEMDVERKYVETCDGECDDGECVEECECTTGICCDGCHYRDDDFVCDSDREVEYSCPWGTGCGSDVGVRSKIRFQYCSGDDNDCDGDWGNWGNWGSWRVNDYCSNSETCSYGDSTCNYNSSCQSQPIYTNYKQCYDNDVYWFRSDGQRLSKYMECEDDNLCTLDECSGDRCVNDLVCDGSTCAKGTGDYCESCSHCGDGVCNCEEDFCSCSADCKLPSAEGLAVSALVKMKGESNPWKKDLSVEPGDDLSFLIVVATAQNTSAENVTFQNVLPQNIQFVGDLKINDSFSGGSLVGGVNLGTLPAGESKVITFEAKVESAANFSLGSTYLNDISTVRYDDGKTANDSVGIEVIKGEGIAAAGSLFSQIVKVVGSLAFWLVILFLIVFLVVISLVAYYFLVKRKRMQIV